MKQKIILSLLTTAVLGTAVAQAPQIDAARIDSMVANAIKQAEQNPQMQGQVNGAEIRKEVTKQLQTFEILKAEALKAGVDKDAEVQNQLKNLEAQFYAAKYAEHLEKTISIDEADIRSLYDANTRTVKIQQVNFKTAAEAKAAQDLLLKGLSFDELIKRYPGEEPQLGDFVHPQQLPPQFANVISSMVRGEVTHEPVSFNGKFYLIKLSAEQRDPKVQPYEQVKDSLIQQAKQKKVSDQILKLLKDNGIE